jgi:hypothetical protein
MLVPNFESRADATDNLEFFCAPVCVLFYISSSNHHSDLNLSCSQVPTTHVVTTQAGSKSQSQNGSTTAMVQENGLLPMGRRNVALATTLQAALSAQSIMIGIILSKSHMSSPIPFALISLFSIRAKLRDAAPGYDITSSFFLRCLYQGEDGDPENPLEGFLKGPLLVRVSCRFITMLIRLLILLWQAFRHIFTSPSSAAKNENSEVTSRRRDVANVLRMNHHVTPRSIGYAATQVR